MTELSTDDKIIRLPQVMEMVGLKKSAIYNLIADGTFPKQVKLGKHASGWSHAAVQEWVKKRTGTQPERDDEQRAA